MYKGTNGELKQTTTENGGRLQRRLALSRRSRTKKRDACRCFANLNLFFLPFLLTSP